MPSVEPGGAACLAGLPVAPAAPHLHKPGLPAGPHPNPVVQEGISFHATRDKLLPRPWAVDDLDALLDRLCRCASLLGGYNGVRVHAPKWCPGGGGAEAGVQPLEYWKIIGKGAFGTPRAGEQGQASSGCARRVQNRFCGVWFCGVKAVGGTHKAWDPRATTWSLVGLFLIKQNSMKAGRPQHKAAGSARSGRPRLGQDNWKRWKQRWPAKAQRQRAGRHVEARHSCNYMQLGICSRTLWLDAEPTLLRAAAHPPWPRQRRWGCCRSQRHCRQGCKPCCCGWRGSAHEARGSAASECPAAPCTAVGAARAAAAGLMPAGQAGRQGEAQRRRGLLQRPALRQRLRELVERALRLFNQLETKLYVSL